jgi:hypothetical protein
LNNTFFNNNNNNNNSNNNNNNLEIIEAKKDPTFTVFLIEILGTCAVHSRKVKLEILKNINLSNEVTLNIEIKQSIKNVIDKLKDQWLNIYLKASNDEVKSIKKIVSSEKKIAQTNNNSNNNDNFLSNRQLEKNKVFNLQLSLKILLDIHNVVLKISNDFCYSKKTLNEKNALFVLKNSGNNANNLSYQHYNDNIKNNNNVFIDILNGNVFSPFKILEQIGQQEDLLKFFFLSF